MKRPLLPLVVLLLLPIASFAQKGELAARTEEEILKTVTLPEGYSATVFAMPPQGGYPTSVSAAIDGTIFVAIDQNGSLGRDRNLPGKQPGKVVRMRDTDGDGRADEFKTFAEMESPRGVIWDGPSGTAPGTLYVMHPPNLTAYTDTDGDGVSDKSEDMLTGLGFDLGFRGADHTTNGCRLAIDGFIYIAMGDYGCIGAKGKDGTTLTHRGGGIVRIRPDGTGLELVSEGQRNIYDVAVSPTLDLFTRDNTNDGGGWNVRLSFVPPGAQMGYPTLFVNFPEDHLQPLADLGGGSPCGVLWLDEPGLPGGLFTVEWGRNAIMRHTLKAKGAGWELDGPNQGQEEWIKIVRPTDMDVDASGALFITSWEGATFNYNGPNAGYVLRVVKKDAPAATVPDFGKMNASQLANVLQGPSATLRLAALRQLKRRLAEGDKSKVAGRPQLNLEQDLAAERIAYLAALVQIPELSRGIVDQLVAWAKAVKVPGPLLAMVDDTPVSAKPAVAGFAVESLRDPAPRVRAAAITALRRLGKADAAPNILPLVADEDPIISHLAIRALSELKASQVCLAALDADDDKVKPGALQALYAIRDPAVVDGLIQRLGSTPVPGVGRGVPPRRTSETAPIATPSTSGNVTPPEVRAGGTPAPTRETRALSGPATDAAVAFDLRRGILNALCRLDLVDAPYLDPKEWWSTRPDTSGPVYKPEKWSESEKIEAALKREADAAQGEDARWLIQRMYLTKVSFPGLIEQLLAACGNDTPARLGAIEGLFRHDFSLPAEGVKALSEIAANATETPELRARALRLLQRGSSSGSVFPAATAAFASLAGHDIGQPAITAVFEDFTRDAKNTKWLGDFSKALADNEPARRALAATVLVNLASSTLVKGKDHDAATAAVEKGWAIPESAAALLTAIARTKSKAFATQVDAHLKDPNNAVAEAALFAHQALGLGAGATQKQIGQMSYEDVFAAVQKGGDAKAGQEMFLRAGCIACHTINPDEPPKGPILSAVAKMYDRATLTESILKPNAKLAQGFESAFFITKKGEQIEGFVTREGGDSVDVRNIVGQVVTIEKGDIKERGHRPQSMMPEGLLNAFTPAELANLLAWLESLKS